MELSKADQEYFPGESAAALLLRAKPLGGGM